MNSYEFLAKQIRVRNAKDIFMLLLKLAIVLFIGHEAYDAICYLRCSFSSEYHFMSGYFFFFKQIIFVLIIYFLYKLMKKFHAKGILKRRIIFIIIICVITSWINGSILGIYFWDGPYWGRVVDADTGEPIEGANVMGRWEFKVLAIPTYIYVFADTRETVTDEKGRFFLPLARKVWLWPFSAICMDELFVFKPYYDSHPPQMQRAWTDEDKEKWRLRLNKLVPEREPGYSPISDTNYFNDLRYVPGRYERRYRVKCKIYKPTIIKLNKTTSIEEQWEATSIPKGDVCVGHKITQIKTVLNNEEDKLSRMRR